MLLNLLQTGNEYEGDQPAEALLLQAAELADKVMITFLSSCFLKRLIVPPSGHCPIGNRNG